MCSKIIVVPTHFFSVYKKNFMNKKKSNFNRNDNSGSKADYYFSSITI